MVNEYAKILSDIRPDFKNSITDAEKLIFALYASNTVENVRKFMGALHMSYDFVQLISEYNDWGKMKEYF